MLKIPFKTFSKFLKFEVQTEAKKSHLNRCLGLRHITLAVRFDFWTRCQLEVSHGDPLRTILRRFSARSFKILSMTTVSRVPRALVFALSLGAFTMVGFQNCSKTNFSASQAASDTNNNGQGQNCEDTLQQLTVPVKVLIIVDISGSNYGDVTIIGTDRDRSRRRNAIQNFFDAYRHKSNFSWGITVFGGDASNSLITPSNANGNSYFTNSTTEMQTAINTFNALNDEGLTPYIPALTLAKNILTADKSAAANTKYIVVFISDGMPDPPVSDGTLSNYVKAVINTKKDATTFNSIYYGFLNQDASNTLKSMASAGNGQFLDTNNNGKGSDINIGDVVSIAGTKCQ